MKYLSLTKATGVAGCRARPRVGVVLHVLLVHVLGVALQAALSSQLPQFLQIDEVLRLLTRPGVVVRQHLGLRALPHLNQRNWQNCQEMLKGYLVFNLLEASLDVVPEVLTGLGQEGLHVNMRVLLLEVVQLLQTSLGQLLLADLLENLHQSLVISFGEFYFLLLS